MSDEVEKKIGRAVGEGLGMKKKEPERKTWPSYQSGYPARSSGYSAFDTWDDDDWDDWEPKRERGAAHHKPTPPSTSKTTAPQGRDSIAMSHVVTLNPPVKFGKYVPVNKAYVLDDLTVNALKREIVAGISRTCDQLGLVFSPGLRDRVSELAEDVLFEGAFYDRRDGYYLLRREGEEDE